MAVDVSSLLDTLSGTAQDGGQVLEWDIRKKSLRTHDRFLLEVAFREGIDEGSRGWRRRRGNPAEPPKGS